MRVLVTGGTGFVGSAVRQHLKNLGYDVRLLIREGGEKRLGGDDDYDVVTGDILNSNACLKACDGMNAVVHLVGIIREYPHRGITFQDLHTAATFTIADAAKRMGVRRFVHMSALGSRENAVSMYHRTKYEAEQIVRGCPFQWTIFRPSVIFEKGSEFIQMLVDIARRRIVPVIDGGKYHMQPIALSDVSDCMSRAVDMPGTNGQVYELGGPDQVTFREMVEAVASALGVQVRTFDVPAWLVRPVVRMMERFPAFPLTGDQLSMLCEDNVCDLEPYTQAFGIRPASFVHAIPALVR